ncbi:MAG TPA: hypothetical protein VFW78_01005 [Bacteroidia bacterium]|nr:hypothetical protein [Bacteroidia bacterium]
MNKLARYGFVVLFITFGVAGIQSCYYDVEEELYPNVNTSCDTTGVTYTNSIVPVLSANCYSCHNQGSAQGGVILDDYLNVYAHATDGTLLGAIRWDAGYKPMPQGGAKLNDCTIKIFETWVNAGAPDN